MVLALAQKQNESPKPIRITSNESEGAGYIQKGCQALNVSSIIVTHCKI